MSRLCSSKYVEKGIQGFITGYKKHNNTVTNPSYNYLVHEMKYWQAGFVFTNFIDAVNI